MVFMIKESEFWFLITIYIQVVVNNLFKKRLLARIQGTIVLGGSSGKFVVMQSLV